MRLVYVFALILLAVFGFAIPATAGQDEDNDDEHPSSYRHDEVCQFPRVRISNIDETFSMGWSDDHHHHDAVTGSSPTEGKNTIRNGRVAKVSKKMLRNLMVRDALGDGDLLSLQQTTWHVIRNDTDYSFRIQTPDGMHCLTTSTTTTAANNDNQNADPNHHQEDDQTSRALDPVFLAECNTAEEGKEVEEEGHSNQNWHFSLPEDYTSKDHETGLYNIRSRSSSSDKCLKLLQDDHTLLNSFVVVVASCGTNKVSSTSQSILFVEVLPEDIF